MALSTRARNRKPDLTGSDKQSRPGRVNTSTSALSILLGESGEDAAFLPLIITGASFFKTSKKHTHCQTQSSFSAVFLWPIPLSLNWPHSRFHSVRAALLP